MGAKVFCEDLNSNSVFKLFILIWSYEGMKVMNLGFVKSNGKLFIMLKFDVFIFFSVMSGNLILHSFVDVLI